MKQNISNPNRRSVLFELSILIFVMLLGNSSCKKFVVADPPLNQIISELVFENDKTAASTVTGLYSRIVANSLISLNGAISVYPALSADEIYNTVSSTTYDPFASNVLATNSIGNALWGSFYSHIYHANACIEGLTKSNKISVPLKNQLLGEVYFLRALNYFYLVNLFGDVPLIQATDYRITVNLPRASSDDVYKSIVEDLKISRNLLQPTYPTAGQVRANKWVATTLLARVSLYQKDWVNAEALATEVINSGTYAILPNLASVFLADSKEAVLQFAGPASTLNTSEGNVFLPASASVLPPFTITNTLLNSFEGTDKRKTSWLSKNTVASKDYYYPAKYKVKSNTVKSEFTMVFRYAELFLIRAEARAMQNKLSGVNGAESDLNSIRSRAGLLGVTVTTQESMLLAIEKERQLELFTEYGHRWFDLKRTARLDAVLSPLKPQWKSSSALYPIPNGEIEKNPTLTQNPGYQ